MTVPSIQSFQVPKLFHKTWAGTFQCKPQAYFQPHNLEEIRLLVNEARKQKKTLMAVGSGHSPSDLTMTNDWVVNLDNFNQVLDVQKHSSGKYTDVTVEAGIRIYQLNEYLKTKQLAIQNLGSISDQSIAGIISTGTHGSSPFHGLVSQQIVDLTLMRSNGELVKCSSHENVNLFKAALLSLGKIGLIVQVTLRTIPRYQIKSNQEIIKFETLLKNWDDIWTSNEFIRCWWFPYTEKCVLWRATKTTEPLSAPRTSWYGTKIGRLFYESLLWVSVHIFPKLTPYIESFVFHQQYGRVETLGKGDYAVQGSVEGLNMDCLFSQFVNEWTAPLSDGIEVLKKLDEEIKRAAKNNEYYVHAPMEVRCSNTTSTNVSYTQDEFEEFLSNRDLIAPGPVPGNNLKPYLDNTPNLPYEPSQAAISNANLTLYINATMYRPFGTNVKIHQWYKYFEKVMGDVGGKPHWAKNFIGYENDANKHIDDEKYQVDFGGKKDYKMFGFKNQMNDWFANLDDFKQARREVDPDGVFLSSRQWALRNGIVDETD